jgi:hypothetical protein
MEYAINNRNSRKYFLKENPIYLGRNLAYDATSIIRDIGLRNGYKIPERISLPYLGSPEQQSNKTSI